jgi:hypothetical protein
MQLLVGSQMLQCSYNVHLEGLDAIIVLIMVYGSFFVSLRVATWT